MLTASAMGRYEHEIARAGRARAVRAAGDLLRRQLGSQATTLVIRAMALGRGAAARLVARGAARVLLGACRSAVILATIGMIRVLVWESIFHTYGPHAGSLAVTVGVALVGVVLWGTLVGSMLPFLLRRLRFDPASASAPFVATLVDVTGLVIYFTAAQLILRGKLL
jgi:magnesium transporter